MPKSKNRKKHKQKANARGVKKAHAQKAQQKKMETFIEHLKEQTKLNLAKRQEQNDEEE